MNCTQTQNLIHAYHDRELDLVRHLEIEHHLQDCPDCARVHESLQVLRTGLRAEEFYHKAPAGLRERLHAGPRIAGETAPPVRWEFRWRVLGIAAAAAVLLSLGWGLGRFVGFGRAPTETVASLADSGMAHDIVASHVRSLMEAHLVDVASDNRHVVKPFFIGKVDIAPNVKDDLSVEGFTLVGGRLDYLDNRPAAAIVYKKDKHVINLFLWQAAPNAPDTLQSQTLQGYELRHWVQSGMNYGVVSDLNATDLNEFVKRVRNP